MATVFIPSLMQKLTNGEHLEKAFPGIKERLVDDDRIKPNISVAVDGEVSPLGMLEKVAENSEVHFLPAIGGGY